jgi:hypothetical protein
MKGILPTLIVLLVISCDNKEDQESPLFIDLSHDIVTPKQYIVTKTGEQMIIDGRGNESSWQSALFTDSFIDIEGVKTPKFDTKVKMLWDDNYLYVYAQMEEPHVWGNITQRDAVIFYNNDFEVFISPSGTTRNYGEIEINSLGTVWDLLLNKPYRDYGKAINHWNLDSLKSAVEIIGTLNDPSDIDSLWTVEMAIPMKGLLELKNGPKSIPKEDEQWRINFSRVEWDHDIINGVYQRKKDNDGKFQSEYNWVWSNQNVINMHEPEKWGFIQFTNATSSEGKIFVEDEYSQIKQVAYALLRQTRSGSLKELLKENSGTSRVISAKHSDLDTLTSTFYKTNFGFEYIINVQPSNKTFMINETGTLKEIK